MKYMFLRIGLFIVFLFLTLGLKSQTFLYNGSDNNNIPADYNWQTSEFYISSGISCDGNALYRYTSWSDGFISTNQINTIGEDMLVSYDFALENFVIGQDWGSIRTQYTSDGVNWIDADTLNYLSMTTGDCTNRSVILPFSTLAVNSAVVIRLFTSYTPSVFKRLNIDNLTIREDVNCQPVLNMDLISSSETEVEITLTSLGSESEWMVEYGEVGFTQGEGTSF